MRPPSGRPTDGTHQFGQFRLIINAEAAPQAVAEPYFAALEQKLSEAFGRPCRFAQPSAAMQEAPRSAAKYPIQTAHAHHVDAARAAIAWRGFSSAFWAVVALRRALVDEGPG